MIKELIPILNDDELKELIEEINEILAASYTNENKETIH